jgi:predicted GIY-YIG superfamily endonuclease
METNTNHTLVVDADYTGEAVYLLHLERPYKHARHYLGHATNLQARLAQHAAGNGARLLQVVMEAGIGWTLARTWLGGRELERRLKRQKNSPRLCPICQAQLKRRERR